MARLGLWTCRPLALRILPRLCREGLVAPFRSWKHPAAASLLGKLEAGKPFDEALKSMSPRFPRLFEAILLEGLRLRMLDYAAEDLRQAYRSPHGLEARLEALGRKWRTRNPAVVCVNGGCLEREILKILRRARTEGATEVVLKEDGEQVYLGVKPVRVIEGGLAGVHAAMRIWLQTSGARRRGLHGWLLRRGRLELTLRFPRQIGDVRTLAGG